MMFDSAKYNRDLKKLLRARHVCPYCLSTAWHVNSWPYIERRQVYVACTKCGQSTYVYTDMEKSLEEVSDIAFEQLLMMRAQYVMESLEEA